jgi:flagellar basal-body rod protein FlgB
MACEAAFETSSRTEVNKKFQALNRLLTMLAAISARQEKPPGRFETAMTDLPLVSILKTRMHWQQSRQKLIAENVSNSDTPNFKPRDLKQISTNGSGQAGGISLTMTQTSPLHLAAGGLEASSDPESASRFETQPSGNGVNLETEMVKAADNQADYQLAISLYQKSLAMLRTAAGAKA